MNGSNPLKKTLGSIRQKWFAAACRRFARRNSVAFRRAMEAAGFQVARDEDYYSPLPSVSRLKSNAARWNRPSALRGLDYDVPAMESTLDRLLARYLDEF